MKFYLESVAVCLALTGTAAVSARAQTLDELKAEYAAVRQTFVGRWDAIAKIRALPNTPMLLDSNEITPTQCQEIERRIAGQYEFSPFDLVYVRGSSHFSFCSPGGFGGRYVPLKFYFYEVNMKNQFGLPIRYIVQALSKDFVDSSVSSLYLDANYRMVEVTTQASVRPNPAVEPYSATVRAIDADGNYFNNGYQPAPRDVPYEVQQFTLADGSVQDAFRIKRVRRQDKGSGVVVLEGYQRTTAHDWDRSFLPVTLGGSGAFFVYGEQMLSSPKNMLSLNTYFHDGREVCANGSVRVAGEGRFIEAPNASSGMCGNDW